MKTIRNRYRIGPILFPINITDIFKNNLNGNITCYAEDTVLLLMSIKYLNLVQIYAQNNT